jgi:SAM-dependent methyltransferase
MTTAMQQGTAWGTRADDWSAGQEWRDHPAYEALLGKCEPCREVRLLDVGCGSGHFASMAEADGAWVAGIDASLALIEIAERRVPHGAFRVGDMEHLPYGDCSFGIVTGINSFQYAADPMSALVEAVRVTRFGGRLVVLVWGPEDECDAAEYLQAIHAMQPPGAAAPEPFALSRPGMLEQLLTEAGLAACERYKVRCTWVYSDSSAALRGLLSTGPAITAIEQSGEGAVGEAVLKSIRSYRCRSGMYLLRNTFHYLVGTR